MSRLLSQMVVKPTDLSVLVTPSEIDGVWVSHCLDLDIVSQGDSVEHAMKMLLEAVGMLVMDDLAHGLDPMERPSADSEYWELADRIRLFDGKTPIFEAFNVEKEMETLLYSKIGLPSGGTIVIQEAALD